MKVQNVLNAEQDFTNCFNKVNVINAKEIQVLLFYMQY